MTSQRQVTAIGERRFATLLIFTVGSKHIAVRSSPIRLVIDSSNSIRSPRRAPFSQCNEFRSASYDGSHFIQITTRKHRSYAWDIRSLSVPMMCGRRLLWVLWSGRQSRLSSSEADDSLDWTNLHVWCRTEQLSAADMERIGVMPWPFELCDRRFSEKNYYRDRGQATSVACALITWTAPFSRSNELK